VSIEQTGPLNGPAVTSSSRSPAGAVVTARISELTRRILFAAVAGPAVVVIVRLGGLPFAALVGAAAAVGAWELFRLARAGGSDPLVRLGVPLAAALPLIVASEPRGVFELPPALLAANLLVVLTAAIWMRGASGRPLASVGATLFGIAYTGGLLSFAVGIRYHRFVTSEAGGAVLLLLPVVATWANDIGGYVAGRLFGRRKLLPAVSPGKTVAGAVGGLVATLAVSWVYVQRILQPIGELGMRPRNLVVFAIVVSTVGQIGDLAESLLKREAGVKDSSGIFPGHGGVLDRIDSLLFVLPVAWALFEVRGVLIPTP